VWPLLAKAFIARKRYVAAVACLREATAAGASAAAFADEERALQAALGPALSTFRERSTAR